MDPSKLPGRALIDSGVLTRALGDLPSDSDTPACRDFWQAMLAAERDILIAAPSVAEVIRLNGTRSVPRSPQIEVVAFDQVAAEILGRRFPMAVLKQLKHAGTTLTHFKYDALIVACAVRHNADCIVALDPDIFILAQHTGLPSYQPSHYRTAPVPMRPLFPSSGAPPGSTQAAPLVGGGAGTASTGGNTGGAGGGSTGGGPAT